MSRTQIPGSQVKNNSIDGDDLLQGSPGQFLLANSEGKFVPTTLSGAVASVTSTGVVTAPGAGVTVTNVNSTTTLSGSQAGFVYVTAPASGSINITLPSASANNGVEFTFFLANDATLAVINILSPNGAISGRATIPLQYQYQSLVIKSNGSQWFQIGGSPVLGFIAGEIPAYWNTQGDRLESLTRQTYAFGTATTLATRNIYLQQSTGISSQSPNGVVLPRNAVIKNLYAQIQATVSANTSWTVYKNGAVLTSFVMTAANRTITSQNPNLTLAAGDVISLYIGNTVNVLNPQAWLELAWIA